ncbi:MAG: hypothetical protein ACRERU_01200 [Methylococcales bacterium]
MQSVRGGGAHGRKTQSGRDRSSRQTDFVAERYAVDRQRVYAVCTSNGGNLVQRLAMESPEQFAAVASVVSAMPKINRCRTSRKPTPILYMNGTEDPLLPDAGGPVGKDRARR